MAYTDAMEEAWFGFADADTMEEGRRIFVAMSGATWAMKETKEVTQATKLKEDRPGPREEQLPIRTSPMTNMSAEVDGQSSSSPTYVATAALLVLGGAKKAKLVGSSRPPSKTQLKPIYSNLTTRKCPGLNEACHEDKAEVHREAAFMDWRKRGGNTREELLQEKL